MSTETSLLILGRKRRGTVGLPMAKVMKALLS